jgi:hypothetical protein
VAEAVEDTSIPQQVEPVAGASDGTEGKCRELFGGEGSVLVEEVKELSVAGGDPGEFGGDS